MTTSRQVIHSLYRGKRAERVGLVGQPWPDTLVAWVQQGYPTRMVYKEAGEQRRRYDWADGIMDNMCMDTEAAGEYEEPVPPWEHFGFDVIGVGPSFDAWPLRGGPGGTLASGQLIEETDEWVIRRNGAGATMRWWKHKFGTPEHIGFHMVTRDIWERDYRPHLLDLDPGRVRVEEMRKNLAAARETGLWVNMGHEFIWERARQSMGDVCLYESLILDPEWIHDYNRVHTDFYKKHWAYVFEQVGLPDSIWLYEDLGYKNGLFASPVTLERLIFPYYKEMVEFLHDYGLVVCLHTCGSTAEALPLIVEAGFDVVNPIERKALNNDPFLFAEEYGDRLAFCGGLDARVFESNDKDIIRREVADYVEGMKARGARLVFSEDHSISPNTRYESYLYALQVCREHMRY